MQGNREIELKETKQAGITVKVALVVAPAAVVEATLAGATTTKDIEKITEKNLPKMD